MIQLCPCGNKRTRCDYCGELLCDECDDWVDHEKYDRELHQAEYERERQELDEKYWGRG